MRTELRIDQLHCAHEIAAIRAVLSPVAAITDLKFDLLDKRLTVIHSSTLPEEELKRLIAKTGMKVTACKKRQRERIEGTIAPLVVTSCSGLALLCAFFFQQPYFYLLALLLGVAFIVRPAWFALRRLAFDMHVLMVVALIGALLIHQWAEAAVVAFLFSLSLLLESYSVRRAHLAISSLMSQAPQLAYVVNRGEIDVREVLVGEQILIRPGQRVPLDAEVLSGDSEIDEAPITGESRLVPKREGDPIYAGTLNQQGTLIGRVTQGAGHTILDRITDLIEQARSERSNAELWVEQFARIYTPLMFFLALCVLTIPPFFFGASWTLWTYHALVILVIACPCALVIATPVAMVSAMTAAAKVGVLIKNGRYLEYMASLQAIAFDKTGTLTYGKPVVQQIHPFSGHSEEELLERALALEEGSEHPLARAIFDYAGRRAHIQASHFQRIKGKGGQALYQGKLFWIGSHRFMHEMGQETSEIHDRALQLEDAGHSVIAIGNEDHVCGLISVADAPRKEAQGVIDQLNRLGIKEICLLTGDHKKTAHALATELGIGYHADLLPEEKLRVLSELKRKWGQVAMVGEGMNDAPAMAAATVGIAMGVSGSDLTLETCDIALMADRLDKIPWLIGYARLVKRVVKQNVAAALSVKLIFLLLALSRLASLWLAVAADTGASLLVIANALTLLKRSK